MRYLACILLLTLAACGKAPTPPKPSEPQAPQGRAETQGIRNTEAIGVSGNAIANQVDGVLNQNDQRMDQLNKNLDAQEGAH